MKHVDDKPANWAPVSNHEPQWIQCPFNPGKRGDYERALAEVGALLAPITCDDTNKLQYAIVPRRQFDPISRTWLYVLDAIHVDAIIRNPEQWRREWK